MDQWVYGHTRGNTIRSITQDPACRELTRTFYKFTVNDIHLLLILYIYLTMELVES